MRVLVAGPEITEARGMLRVAEPLDSCTPLKNHLANSLRSNFALIIRGGCSFQKKVRSAQAAGFDLAIVYNNKYRYSELFFSMEGDDKDIRITGYDDSVDAFTLMVTVNKFLRCTLLSLR
ncbi:Receptor homology region, transmembrane domain- and RING domain-containing protein 6 [Carex littledalei]|uniref:Receptor homology region, transmembrane domain-and RING domain-containing protein 6 n=1 Tax=Carex littledalei TaxID=544730 RepID=A0A833RGF4_9POAL|nr:Receptor homology region, transmembrane domain- and RING domain-containing protein 6 [Carex littledalei]